MVPIGSGRRGVWESWDAHVVMLGQGYAILTWEHVVLGWEHDKLGRGHVIMEQGNVITLCRLVDFREFCQQSVNFGQVDVALVGYLLELSDALRGQEKLVVIVWVVVWK